MDIRTIAEENRGGRRIGLPSFCTSNEEVLDSIFRHAAGRDLPILVEATCNQVNQDGGYTGMKPADFIALVHRLASRNDIARSALLVGGDHLGPNPWRHMPAGEAMGRARDLVRAYVEAGFTKIHLDASMACGGEPLPDFELVAARAADLARIAERYAPEPDRLVYVIGTEVPVPGGETDDMASISITTADRFHETVESHRRAFEAQGLDAAWSRVVSVVTQPGVDFSHSAVHPFDREEAAALSASILDHAGLTFEAHSTDYQTADALSQLVESHFLFLKVGPELTFAYREAILALAHIESRLGSASPSRVEQVLLEAMERDPQHWSNYYRGSEREVALLKLFSLSDRVRYYWPLPAVQAALARLRENLALQVPPSGLVRQYGQAAKPSKGGADLYRNFVDAQVAAVLDRYYGACGMPAEA